MNYHAFRVKLFLNCSRVNCVAKTEQTSFNPSVRASHVDPLIEYYAIACIFGCLRRLDKIVFVVHGFIRHSQCRRRFQELCAAQEIVQLRYSCVFFSKNLNADSSFRPQQKYRLKASKSTFIADNKPPKVCKQLTGTLWFILLLFFPKVGLRLTLRGFHSA